MEIFLVVLTSCSHVEGGDVSERKHKEQVTWIELTYGAAPAEPRTITQEDQRDWEIQLNETQVIFCFPMHFRPRVIFIRRAPYIIP